MGKHLDVAGTCGKHTLTRNVDLLWCGQSMQDDTRPLSGERLRDGRDLAGVKIAAIGQGTAEVLADHNLVADLIPERFIAESLLEAFPLPHDASQRRVLLARAEVARDVLPDGLREMGWRVDVVDASLIDLARDGDEILTSDPGDLAALAFAAGKTLIITPV